MSENISFIAAFGAGLASFLLPCVLPLMPVYLASLYQPGRYEAGRRRPRLTLFLHSLAFVIGFTVIFTMLGAVAGITGQAIALSSTLLNKIAAGLLIAFGVFILAALKLPWLNFERRLNLSAIRTTGYLRSFLIGAAFSLGWTPCVAPVLGGILSLAAVRATAWQGAYLLSIYSLGLGIPFLIIGAAFDSLLPLLRHIQRYSNLIYITSGLLLIAMGILILTNKLSWFSSLAV